MVLAIIMLIGCIIWWICSAWDLLTSSDENWGAFILSMTCTIITAVEMGVKYFES